MNATEFENHRRHLTGVAYRMLGTLSDAEDVVQETYVRFAGVDVTTVRDVRGWLTTTVARICLDELGSARARRERYVGPWLPEPVVEEAEDAEVGDEDVTLPLMLALERLSPLERAAFLLHDVFGISFEEIAVTIGRSPAACRQLAARARTHVRAERPRFRVERERGLAIAGAFFAASRSGDMAALGAMLAADVSMHADGGGKRPAAQHPFLGFDAVMRVHASLATLFRKHGSTLVRTAFINGLPGFVTREADGAAVAAVPDAGTGERV